MIKHRTIVLMFAALLVFPWVAHASDFARLTVAIIALMVAFGNTVIALIIFASKSRPLIVCLLCFALIGAAISIGMSSDEARHMSDGDYYGTLALVLIPTALSLIATVFSLRSSPNIHETINK